MDGFAHEIALKELLKLDEVELAIVFTELLERKKVTFHRLSEIYTNYLKQEQNRQADIIAKLSLHLGMDVIDEKTATSISARRTLYDLGLFKGSKFGDKLEKEFS